MNHYIAIFNINSIMAHYLSITNAMSLPVPICMSIKIIISYSSTSQTNKMSVNITQLFLKFLFIKAN